MLESLNVLAVLKRGYAIVKQGDGHVVPSAAGVADGMALTLQFYDGERRAVAGEGGVAKSVKKPKAVKAPQANQPGLFDG